MTIEELRTAPLNKLIELSYTLESQDMLNIVYFEMACRIYVPFGEKSFDEILLELGYIPTKRDVIDKGQRK